MPSRATTEIEEPGSSTPPANRRAWLALAAAVFAATGALILSRPDDFSLHLDLPEPLLSWLADVALLAALLLACIAAEAPDTDG